MKCKTLSLLNSHKQVSRPQTKTKDLQDHDRDSIHEGQETMTNTFKFQ